MTTFNKQETALFLADGDFWYAVSANKSKAELSNQLDHLYETANDVGEDNLYGTFPDDTVVCIGTSPRRPKP